jgi:clan AA aspartic protease
MIHRMGLTYVTVKLTAPAGSRRSYSASFLVDTGATDSMAPARQLRKAGIKPVGKTAYELAHGQVKEFQFGLAQIEFMGEITSGRVIFADDDTEPLLGVTALESVGILVDTANKTLKRLPAIPLKGAAGGPLRRGG